MIPDLENYTKRMSYSLIDKIFFMDKIDSQTEVIVDYGCADGSLISFLAPLFSDILFVGYDNSSDMIDLAQKKNNSYKNVSFFSDIIQLKKWLNDHRSQTTALVLSSVIHEIYSYGSAVEINHFWRFVNNSDFNSIVIRDMAFDRYAYRPSNKYDVLKVYSHQSTEKIREFEMYHGSILQNENLIHFLIKSPYVSNWEREVRENYFPLMVHEIMPKISPAYKLIYHEHFTLPYVAQTIKQNFDIDIKDYTHAKFIFKG